MWVCLEQYYSQSLFLYAIKMPQNRWHNCTESSLNVSCDYNHKLCSALSTTQQSTRLANTCLVRSTFYDNFHTAPRASHLKSCAQLASFLSSRLQYSPSLFLLLSLISSMFWMTKDAYQPNEWVIKLVWRGQSCLKGLTTSFDSLVKFIHVSSEYVINIHFGTNAFRV